MFNARKVNKGSKVRYAVVAGGWISQQAFMPGVLQTSNSKMTAIITGDKEKGTKLGQQYNLKFYSYDDYDKALKEGQFDALYIATPNWMHKQYAVPALEAGYHVLLEKAMEDTSEDCQAIINASKKSGAKLMIAYRLHCEPGTVDIINRVRNGELGDLRIFNSVFTQLLKPDNHRAQNGFSAGPVPDMGVYCINAARNIFGSEPIEVSALGYRTPGVDFNCDDTVSVTMKFPGERIATFLVSYTAKSLNMFSVMGTEGNIVANPSYMFGKGLSISYTEQLGKDQPKSKNFPETDQFAGETEYFSKCILEGIEPEPDGEEGLRDVRVVEAIKRSLESGKVVSLDPLDSRKQRATEDQVFKFKYGKVVKDDDLINADTPAEK
jgi:predicted dehydrogenase